MEDFVFPASKLIVEARNGSGTCGPLKTFHVVQIIKGNTPYSQMADTREKTGA